MPTREIGTSNEELVPENFNRKSFIVQNQDSSNNLFIKEESPDEGTNVSSTDHDIRLGPGDTLFISTEEEGVTSVTARYTVVASAASTRVSFKEFEDEAPVKTFQR